MSTSSDCAVPPAKRQKCEPHKNGLQEGEALRLRKEFVASSQKLFHPDNPSHIVRGQGQYLIDENGQKYLDTMNNVASVGHSHPKVTEACAAQMSLLCTNSRFLNERMSTYAKKLCSTFPAGLSCCFFANSGSEANDLALQIARVYTGRQQVISLVGCYHGNLTSLKCLSSYKLARGTPEDPRVSIASVPDIYRGKYRDPETAGALYAAEVKEIVEKQKREKKDVACFIHESIPSSAGQFLFPKGYVEEVYKCIRDDGGVVIADEVQAGFARVGEHFWAFEVYGVCPDIVTLGKSMGNGHPVSAVITTKEIADKFAKIEYFNTFGGNPVSMAVAESVLTVIEEEGLQQHSKEVGTFLMESLTALQEKHACIGDVRGIGLFIGVDIVKDRESREADFDLAKVLKFRVLDEHKIMLHVDGVTCNVIKIKPPLVITKEDCTRIVEALDSVLTSL